MPRYDILSPDAMEVLERGWRRLISEIGIEFLHDGALEHFRAAGQTVEESVVKFDPDFVIEQVAKAPSEYQLLARNPDRDVHMGGSHMVFAPTQGPPFVRLGDERREGTLADFDNLCRLSQSFDQLDTAGGLPCEPNDLPLDSRHLDMLLSVATLTDKPYQGAVITEDAANDSIAFTEMVMRGRGGLALGPSVYGNINVNSPLRYDTRMLDGAGGPEAPDQQRREERPPRAPGGFGGAEHRVIMAAAFSGSRHRDAWSGRRISYPDGLAGRSDARRGPPGGGGAHGPRRRSLPPRVRGDRRGRRRGRPHGRAGPARAGAVARRAGPPRRGHRRASASSARVAFVLGGLRLFSGWPLFLGLVAGRGRRRPPRRPPSCRDRREPIVRRGRCRPGCRASAAVEWVIATVARRGGRRAVDQPHRRRRSGTA